MADDDGRDWLTEDEVLLAESEGEATMRADRAYARARGRRTALERRGQLERICEVFGLGDTRAYDDVRVRILYKIVRYVDEHVWRETIEDLGRQVLGHEAPALRALRSDRLGMGRDEPATTHDEALFEPDRSAVAGMTHHRRRALALAGEFLEGSRDGLVATDERLYPNPYQDLWVVDPVDPDDPGEERDGGYLVVVPASGEVYRADGGAPPHPTELVGMIGPPDEEWD